VTGDSSEAAIRRIRPDEVEVYREFRLRALADAPDAFSDSIAAALARPPSFWTERVAQTSEGINSVLFVAVDPATDRWLGMTGCYFDTDDEAEAMVVSVWVEPAARRQGLAGGLVRAAQGWAQERGVRTLRLWVVATNPGAQRVYRAAGFAPTGVTRPLPSNPLLDELEMAISF
jgi:RimJ/RimL family protein N-acetyltransferase